jgi:putative hydrolase of the HAD superfamily
MNKYLLWDFDGTLACRDGMWSGALSDAVLRHMPAMTISPAAIRPHLSTGFPWHTPETGHEDIATDEMWWDGLRPVFERALKAVGVPAAMVPAIASAVRDEYLRPGAWRVAEGTEDVLQMLSEEGWKHAIVSNHVPELHSLAETLRLARHFERILSSAQLGYEKPHPAFFERVLASLEPYGTVWVIGDSVRADIGAARAARLPCILIGSFHASANYCVPAIRDVPSIVRHGSAL